MSSHCWTVPPSSVEPSATSMTSPLMKLTSVTVPGASGCCSISHSWAPKLLAFHCWMRTPFSVSALATSSRLPLCALTRW